jgi:hypothetical protein
MGTCRKHFRIFGCIDFKIIAFEGRRKYFFVPARQGSEDFDFRWREKPELYKKEVLEINNVWNMRFLWKKVRGRGRM